jgi:hypothetical protein
MNSWTLASHLHLWASMLQKPTGFSHSTSHLCTHLKDIIKIRLKVIHQYCSGNENLRKLSRGEVYDILIIKTDKKVEVTKLISTIWQVQHAKSPPYGTILTLLWVTWTIAQPLLNLFNKDPIYLYTRKHGLAKQKALTCIVMVATKKHGQRPS